jgi:hypothetical protein
MRQRNKTEMYPLVEKWHQSGKSQLSFSKEQGIKPYTFRYWVKKYEKEKQEDRFINSGEEFVPIQLEAPVKKGGAPIEISYDNGVVLSLRGEVSFEYIKSLIKLGADV